MGKKFNELKGLRWKPKPETYDEMGAKRPIHFREGYCVGGDHQQHYEALMAAGTKDEWWDHGLGTLTAKSPDVSEIVLLRLWKKALRAYNEVRPHETVPYNITANRGPKGDGRASAHLIFDIRDLPDFDVLERSWLKVSAMVGGDWVLSSAGGRATLYWSKNATEPHAIEEHYRCKWSRADLERAEEEAESRVPLPPSPPREHQPAIITRRNGEEIRRERPLYSVGGFPVAPPTLDCACHECADEVLPWIRRANAIWARSHEASA
jgi:hypothetical protein